MNPAVLDRIRPYRGARPFSSLRERAVSKISALTIVTLVLLPFTAPFKTYDLAGARNDSSQDGLPKDQIDSDDKVVGPSDESFVPPVLNVVVAEPHTTR